MTEEEIRKRWAIIEKICLSCMKPVKNAQGKVVGHDTTIDGLSDIQLCEGAAGSKWIDIFFDGGDYWTLTVTGQINESD